MNKLTFNNMKKDFLKELSKLAERALEEEEAIEIVGGLDPIFNPIGCGVIPSDYFDCDNSLCENEFCPGNYCDPINAGGCPGNTLLGGPGTCPLSV